MKYQIALDDKPSHCLHCPLRSTEDGCDLQKDNNGDFIYSKSWEKQMENCPIEEVKSC